MAKKPKKKKRSRTERREAERRAKSLREDQKRLALLEPGGNPDRPLEVESASLVEPIAEKLGCIHCDGHLRTDSHDAEAVDGQLLRRVQLHCARCDTPRTAWVRVVGPSLN